MIWFNVLTVFFSAGFLTGTYFILDTNPNDCGNIKVVLWIIIMLHTTNIVICLINLVGFDYNWHNFVSTMPELYRTNVISMSGKCQNAECQRWAGCAGAETCLRGGPFRTTSLIVQPRRVVFPRLLHF